MTIGLHALNAMDKAGTTGDLSGTDLNVLKPLIRRNALSKLKKYALLIGGKIYNLSMAKTTPLDIVEEALELTLNLLESHPISAEKSVAQVISFYAQGFTMRIKDVLKTKRRRRQIEVDPDFAESTHHEPQTGPSAVALWKEVERRFKSDPELLGPNGEPFAWIYIEGKAGGMTEAEILDQWNEVSRRSGGAGDMTRSALLYWLRQRRSLMGELTKGYLDDATIRRLKLAVARGALDTVLLQPFEREVLELLAA